MKTKNIIKKKGKRKRMITMAKRVDRKKKRKEKGGIKSNFEVKTVISHL